MTSPTNPRHTWAWRKLRNQRLAIAQANQEPCCRCGQPINYQLPGTHRWGPTADHLHPIAQGGHTTPPLEALAPAHRLCNQRHGSRIGHANKRAKKLGYTDPDRQPATGSKIVSSGSKGITPTEGEVQPSPPAYMHTQAGYAEVSGVAAPSTDDSESHDDDPESGPDAAVFASIPWLAPLFPLPAEAVWPRLMSAPHPRAVGSYGTEAIDWIEARRAADPRVPAKAKRLRWFQRLVLLRQWEHDEAGQLVWFDALLGVSRQVGKSVLLAERSMCRVELFPRLAGEAQLVMQVSKDLSAAREVQRPIRLWAESVEDDSRAAARGEGVRLPVGYRPRYVVRGTHGQEEIEAADGSRYMIRGRDSVYSYSVSAAELDEAWGVRPDVVDDGIEPTMAERELPQLCLTSTAHPRATPLFPARRGLALRGLWVPGEDAPLLVEWSAHRSWDFDDPGVWRAASPHWDDRRRRVVGKAHARWAAGDEDAKTLESGGFPFQWLNIWPAVRAGLVPWVQPSVLERCGVPGARPAADRAVVGVSLDRVSGLWPVVVAGRDPGSGSVAVRLVGVFGSQDEAVAAAGGAAGEACVLLLPRGLRGHVRVRGVREVVHVHEADVTAALDLGRVWVASRLVVFDPADGGVQESVLGMPLRRVPGRFDAGTMLLVCAWWAGRDRRVSQVV